MSSVDSVRYRLTSLDRTGWVFGLSGAQCITLASGVALAGILLDLGTPYLIVLLPVVVSLVLGFGRWDNWNALDLLSMAARWKLLSVGTTKWQQGSVEDLSPLLHGIELREVDAPVWVRRLDEAGIGIAIDRVQRTVSATIPIRARKFSLCEALEQDRLLAEWGDVLATFATERSPVRRVTWIERASMATTMESSFEVDRKTDALNSYDDLVLDRRRHAVMHESSLTIAIDLRRVSGSQSPVDAGVGVLLDELKTITFRLEEAGFDVDVPLSAGELRRSIAVCLDPRPGQSATARTLGDLVDMTETDVFPKLMDLNKNWVRAGRSFHHVFWIADWPRLDVRADWMEPLIFGGDGTRTLAIVAEPIAPSRSRKQVDRDATKLVTDENQRVRAGFRVGAEHQRTAVAVAEREDELTSGFVEFKYTGLIAVTTQDVETLREMSSASEQLAAQCGVGLLSLTARHDAALACTLPVGRGPLQRRLS